VNEYISLTTLPEQAYESQLREVMRARRSNRLARRVEGAVARPARAAEERVLARANSRLAIPVPSPSPRGSEPRYAHAEEQMPPLTALRPERVPDPAARAVTEAFGFVARVPSNTQPAEQAHPGAGPVGNRAAAVAPMPMPASSSQHYPDAGHSGAAWDNVHQLQSSGSSVSLRSVGAVTDKILLTLDCIICATRMAEPTTLECGHSFCRSCCLMLAAHGEGHGYRCPLDRSVHHHVPATNVLLREITQTLRQLPSPRSKRPSQAVHAGCS
jgi:hypothetical protein